MKLRNLLATAVLGTLLAAGTGLAQDKSKDFAKPEGERLAFQREGKFQSLYGSADLRARWPGYGSFDAARSVLESALRQAETLYSTWDRVRCLSEGARRAREACGTEAPKYRRLLDVLILASDGLTSTDDKAAGLRGGVDFLVWGRAQTMTQDVLTLGLAMTRPAYSTHWNAYQVLLVAVREAQREAQTENQQWLSLLTFACKVADQASHQESRFLVLDRTARAVAEARQGDVIYLRVLNAIAAADWYNEWDQLKALQIGLRQYRQDVPHRTHQLMADYLAAAGDKVSYKRVAVRMLRSALAKFEALAYDAPAAKVQLQAGLDLSGTYELSIHEQVELARDACQRVQNMDLPYEIRERLSRGLSEANYAYDSQRKLQILRGCMSSLLF